MWTIVIPASMASRNPWSSVPEPPCRVRGFRVARLIAAIRAGSTCFFVSPSHHALQHAVHGAHRRREHIHAGAQDKLARLFRRGHRAHAVGDLVVNGRRTADKPKFAFHHDGGVDRFHLVDRLPVFVTFSSNGNAEPSKTTRSKPAWAASRAFSIEWVWSALRNMGKPFSSRMLRTNAAIWWTPMKSRSPSETPTKTGTLVRER